MITEETYKWIEELLDPKITEISDDDYNRLFNQYFREDKKDWYKKSYIDGLKKDINFRELIRKFFNPRGREKQLYDFSFFKFPSFSIHSFIEGSNFNNLWKDSRTFLFDNEVIFKNTTFHGRVDFIGVIFEKGVSFNNSKFENDLIIQNCTFKGTVFFENSKFNYLNITSSTFSNNFNLINSPPSSVTL